MKEIVTFSEGALGENLGAIRPGRWLAGWLAGCWLAGWLAGGWLAGWQAGAHFCHWSLLILRISMKDTENLNIPKDMRQK